jgi:hypothetical protein
MQGSVDASDYNTSWTSTCSNITFTDATSPTSGVTYNGSYTNGDPVSCDLTWTITNYQNLTCYETTTITFQPIPSADFDLTNTACDGQTVDASLINSDNIPIDTYTWTYSSATEQTGTEDANITLLYEDAVGSNEVCLTVVSNLGCTSTNVCNSTIIKAVPTCDFTIAGPICSGGVTQITYDNNNNPQMPCPSITDWSYNSADITLTATGGGLCVWDMTAENLTGSAVTYPISFQYTVDGCTSEICSDALTVFPAGQSGCCADPVAYAGEDTSLCILDHVLSATLGGGGNWGYWEQTGGPTVTFVPPLDMGDATTPGNPNAHIIATGTGTVHLTWHEFSGSCTDEDEVVITFIEQPNVTFGGPGEDGAYTVCGMSSGVEADANTIATPTWEWINSCGPITTISNVNIFNPTINTTQYINCTFQVIATVAGQCIDTGDVKVSFIEPPTCNAGPDASSCGNQDTLHAVTTFGGY